VRARIRTTRCLSARMCEFVSFPRACVSRGQARPEVGAKVHGAAFLGVPFLCRERKGTKKAFTVRMAHPDYILNARPRMTYPALSFRTNVRNRSFAWSLLRFLSRYRSFQVTKVVIFMFDLGQRPRGMLRNDNGGRLSLLRNDNGGRLLLLRNDGVVTIFLKTL
jgi:hypothetical protein